MGRPIASILPGMIRTPGLAPAPDSIPSFSLRLFRIADVRISVQSAFFEFLHLQCLSFGQMGKGPRGEIDISWNRRAFGGKISRLLKITQAF
jgi:hypothetical protein